MIAGLIRSTVLALGLVGQGAFWAGATAQSLPTVRLLGTTPRTVANNVLRMLAYSATPDGNVTNIEIDRNNTDHSNLSMLQMGSGFTVDPGFPLYLEGYLAGARYDPRFAFSDGNEQRRLPARWNNASATGGIGWDIPLTDRFVLRPIFNVMLGAVASDAALAGFLLEHKYDIQLDFLRRGSLNVAGYGGSLILDYMVTHEAYEIDIELRYTALHLQTFGGTSAAVRGTSDSQTLGLWARLRWQTGWTMFERPVRWVLEGTQSNFFGPEANGLGFSHLYGVGGGIETDTGSLGIGAFGYNLQRLRLMARYVVGGNVSGGAIGIGMSF